MYQTTNGLLERSGFEVGGMKRGMEAHGRLEVSVRSMECLDFSFPNRIPTQPMQDLARAKNRLVDSHTVFVGSRELASITISRPIFFVGRSTRLPAKV
jgi:hypothetical protein